MSTWTFETFHAPVCREHLEDPGARCICRPPAAVEPKKPTPRELEQAKRSER